MDNKFKAQWLFAMDINHPTAYNNQICSNAEPNPHICTLNHSHPQAYANAHLICAAPELLAAAIHVLFEVEAGDLGAEAVGELKSAISKALNT